MTTMNAVCIKERNLEETKDATGWWVVCSIGDDDSPIYFVRAEWSEEHEANVGVWTRHTDDAYRFLDKGFAEVVRGMHFGRLQWQDR